MDKHYVGELNTEVLVDCGRDLTLATVKFLSVRKPDGTLVEWTPTIWNGNYLRYFTQAGDFDQSGEYELQAVVTIGDWSGVGATASFIIYDKFA